MEYEELTEEIGVSVLAAANGLNRREETRIRYPNTTKSPLPRVYLQSMEALPWDISSGGISFDKSTFPSKIEAGDELRLKLSWIDKDMYLRAVLIGKSEHRLHLKWTENSETLKERLSDYSSAATLGSRVRPVYSQLEDVTLDVEELYLGSTGECILFYGASQTLQQGNVFFKWGDLKVKIWWNPFRVQWDEGMVSSGTIGFWMILIAQIPNPSTSLRRLIKAYSELYSDLLKLEAQVID